MIQISVSCESQVEERRRGGWRREGDTQSLLNELAGLRHHLSYVIRRVLIVSTCVRAVVEGQGNNGLVKPDSDRSLHGYVIENKGVKVEYHGRCVRIMFYHQWCVCSREIVYWDTNPVPCWSHPHNSTPAGPAPPSSDWKSCPPGGERVGLEEKIA